VEEAEAEDLAEAETATNRKATRTPLLGVFGCFVSSKNFVIIFIMKIASKLRILEFIIAGLILDLTENIISIKLTTNAKITSDVFLIAFMVVVPFAIITEIIIDHPKFWSTIFRSNKSRTK